MATKTCYEGQVSEEAGLYLLTLTISRENTFWTSHPVPLMARDIEAAQREADVVMRKLASACEGVEHEPAAD